VTSYGAEFIGTSNRFEGKAINAHEIEFMQVRVPHETDRPLPAGAPLVVYIRPESIALNPSPDQGHVWTGVVGQRTFQGDAWDYMVHVGGQNVRVRSYNKDERLQPGDRAYLRPTYGEMIVVSH
jgi:ABC-type Fe3+/spermidine/putrescine transport system ATPase subunit